MEFKDVFKDLRKKAGLSQNDAAEKLFVTRQAVSRWERGETIPEVETLRAASRLFGESIKALLGYPTDLQCQSCGMPITPEQMGRENGAGTAEIFWPGALWRKWWSTACPICPLGRRSPTGGF